MTLSCRLCRGSLDLLRGANPGQSHLPVVQAEDEMQEESWICSVKGIHLLPKIGGAVTWYSIYLLHLPSGMQYWHGYDIASIATLTHCTITRVTPTDLPPTIGGSEWCRQRHAQKSFLAHVIIGSKPSQSGATAVSGDLAASSGCSHQAVLLPSAQCKASPCYALICEAVHIIHMAPQAADANACSTALVIDMLPVLVPCFAEEPCLLQTHRRLSVDECLLSCLQPSCTLNH